MSRKKDELTEAVDTDNPELVARAIKKNQVNPQGKMASNAFVHACGRGVAAIVEQFLNWGAYADAANEFGQRALLAATEAGAADACRLICEAEADVNFRNGEGNTAMNLALNAPHLQVVKVLLKAGAKLSAGANTPGLAGIVKEVQLEKLTEELTKVATTTASCADDLMNADGSVWEAMNEHMRLLKLREEQKAGMNLMSLQSELEEQQKAKIIAKDNENLLTQELIEKKIVLQKAQNNFEDMKKALEHAEMHRETCTAEDTQANSEVAEQKSDLSAAQKEMADAQKLCQEKEQERDSFAEKSKLLSDELAEAKSRHARLRDTLRTESAELRGWERDEKAAAALTAQAGKLLAKAEA